MTSPTDVAAEVEAQAYEFYRAGMAQLTLAASHLAHATKLMEWTPGKADAIGRALDLHACRGAEGPS